MACLKVLLYHSWAGGSRASVCVLPFVSGGGNPAWPQPSPAQNVIYNILVYYRDQIPSIIDPPKSDCPHVYLVYLTHTQIIDGVIDASILPFYLSQPTSGD